MEAEEESDMDIYTSASNIMRLSSDVSMQSSTQTIRGLTLSDRNGTTPQPTQGMEIDSEASTGSDFRVQSLFGTDNQPRKRKGFDRISELEEELSRKEHTIYQLNASASTTAAKVSKLELDVENLRKNLRSSVDDTKRVEGKYKELIATKEKAIAELETECHELGSQITSLQNCNHELTQAKKTSESAQAPLQIELASLQESVKASKNEKNVIQDKFDQLSNDFRQLSQAKKETESAEKLLRAEITSLQESVVAIKNEKKEIQDKFDQLSNELSQAQENSKERVAAIENEKKQLSTEVTDLRNKASTLCQRKDELFQEVEDLTMDIDRLNERSEAEKNKLEEANTQLVNDLGLLKEDYATLQKDTDDLLRQKDQALAELQGRLDEFAHVDGTQSQQKDEEIADLKRRLHESASANQSQLAQKDQEITGLQTLLDNSTTANELQRNAEVGQKQAEIERLKADISTLTNDCAAAATRRQELQQQLSEFKAQAAQEKLESESQIQEMNIKCKNASEELEKERRSLREKIEEKEIKSNELLEQLQHASGQVTATLEEKTRLAEELEKQKLQVANLHDETSTLRDQVQDTLSHNGELSDEQAKLSESISQQRQIIDDLERKWKASDKELKQAHATNEHKITEKEQLLKESEQRQNELQKSVEQLKTEKEGLRKEIERLEQSKTTYQQICDEKDKWKDLCHEKANLCHDLEEKRKKLQSEVDNLKASQATEIERLEQSKTTYQQTCDEKNKWKDLCHEKANLCHDLEEKRKELQSEVDNLKASQAKEIERLEQSKTTYQKICDEKDKWKDLCHEKANLCHDLEEKRKKLQSEVDNLKTLQADNWVARPRFDVLSGRYESLKQTQQSTESRLTETEADLSAVRQELQALKDSSSTSVEELNRRMRERLRDNQKLQNDKETLESVIADLKAKNTTAGANIPVPDQITVLQRESLEKSLKIQSLEREIDILRSSGTPNAAPSPSSSGSASATTYSTQQPSPSMSNLQSPTNPSTSTHFSPARPLNGDIIHDIRSVGGLGRTLARAPVQAELNRVRATYPQWRLPDFSNGLDGSKRHLKPWSKTRHSNYVTEKDKPRNSYLDDESDQDGDEDEPDRSGVGKPGHSGPSPSQGKDKGKQKEVPNPVNKNRPSTNETGSDDDDGSDEESRMPVDNDDEPSDVSQVQKRWENSRPKVGKPTVKNYVNALGRDLLKEAFNVQNIWAIFARDGIKLEKIEEFIRDPIRNAPKLRNTRIDKFAADVKSMKASPWNRALAHNFALKAREIVSSCKDNRFGKGVIDWDKLFSDRLGRIYKDIIDARPKPGETNEARILRIATDHDKRKKRSANRSILHVKRTARADIATIMLGVCRERGDQSGVDFWSYGLNVTEILGDNGMSDEEDDTREVEVEGVKVKQNVKVILQSYWRHSDLDDLFKLMDQAPVLEKLIFHRAGAGRIPRIRSNKLSHRSPPTDLPREFFREEFLAPLFPHEVMELKLAEYTFQRVNFGGYTPTASANEGDSQTNSMQVD